MTRRKASHRLKAWRRGYKHTPAKRVISAWIRFDTLGKAAMESSVDRAAMMFIRSLWGMRP